MRRPWRALSVLIFAASVVGGGLFGSRVLALTDEARERLRLFTELVMVAHERYGAEISYRDLSFAAVQGMLRGLDPHTSFLAPEAYSSMRERQQGSFFGLGIVVGMRSGQLTVITPIDGTPASRLGIRAGDVINTIEGEPTEKMTLDEAVQRLKGPKGTQVRITIVRHGVEEPLELTITRAEIPQTTVRYAYMIAPETGYLAVSDFYRSTAQEMEREINSLKTEGMKRLVLDLRNNGGGLLDQAIAVAEQFLPKGSRIVETRGRTRDAAQTYDAAGESPELGLPAVVLVNSGTASAAEILAGAIQDHDMGLIVGTPTWGKGLVQTVYSLSYGAGLALTTGKYYTPSGRLIQRDYSSFYDYYAHGDGLEEEERPPAPEPQSGEAFLTDLGRKVYGGGGITPDVVVEPAEIPPYLQFLLTRSAFFNFAIDHQSRHSIPTRDWQPGPAVLAEFQEWLTSKGHGTREEIEAGFTEQASREFALRQIRADVLNAAFGLEAAHQALAGADTQIQAALGLFDRAADLLASRRRLEPDVLARHDSTASHPQD